ncbi:hypothetical protein HX858_08815 [Marine Group I thaumarchaeote]|uniref:Uncharacterized protein n=1 Tax=Marine Group I thaumarchaeote TaxID=2511932 RepID=A0A7K4MX01_9ARCH|nr:hypothetical protein [Marine Group I thaumarchaeote]
MNEQKINELNYKFKIRYNEILEEAPNLVDRELSRVISKDTALEVFNTAFSNENTIYPVNFNPPVVRFPVFEGLPAIGKSTGLMQLMIPAITDVIYPENFIPIFLVVIPDSKKVYEQMKKHLQLISERHMIKTILMSSKTQIKGETRVLKNINSSFSMMQGRKLEGVVILTKQGMINDGVEKQAAKEHTKTYISRILIQLRNENPDYRLIGIGMFDEVKVSSQLSKEMNKFKTKCSIEQQISYMPALKDLFNNSILPYVDDFTSIGYDGTPTYDLTTKAPIKTGNKLCGPVQDENFSVMGDYGGGDSIWKVRPLSEKIWKGANALEVAYYSGINKKKLSEWQELVIEMNNDLSSINQYNIKMKENLDPLLKKYGVKVYGNKVLGMVVSGSDDKTKPNSKYVKGEHAEDFLQKQKIPHIFYTDDVNFCYQYDNETLYEKPKNEEFSVWQDKLLDKIDNGDVPLVVVKRKLLWGYDNNYIMAVCGLSEYTDMMPQHDTMKPLTGAKQSSTRAARVFSGLVDNDGNLIYIREAAEVISNIIHDGNDKLANEVKNLVIKNNQFKAYQILGESQVAEHLNVWLKNTYPNKEEFIELFNNHINNHIEQEKDNFHPLKCTCGNCPVHGTLNQKINEEKADKDMPEISEKLNKKLKIAA